MPIGEYMTVKEAAEVLDVSEEYVRRLARCDVLKHINLHKRMSLIDAKSVADYQATRNRKPGRRPARKAEATQ